MLADATLPVPASLMTLLAGLAPLFTAPSFRTFCGLACGFLAQTRKRTVCGMLAGAGLSQLWPHDRAHRFFSRARWSADDLGLAVARLVVALLVPAGQPVTVAIDDTLFKRRGKKAWAASWFHDGSAAGPDKAGYGNNWVIAAVVVRLPILSRPVAIPVLAKPVIKGTSSASRLWLARRMAQAIAAALPGRDIHVVADAACAGKELTDSRPPSPGPPGCARTPRCTISRQPGPAGGAARAPRETSCRPRPGSPPPRRSSRSPSPATARPPPCTPPLSPACGTASSAPGPSRSC